MARLHAWDAGDVSLPGRLSDSRISRAATPVINAHAHSTFEYASLRAIAPVFPKRACVLNRLMVALSLSVVCAADIWFLELTNRAGNL